MGQAITILNSLVQQARNLDPGLAAALIEIVNELDRLGTIVDPAPIVARKSAVVTEPAPLAVANFTYSFTRTNVLLTWTAPQTGFLLYEIRQGLVWDTADRLFVTGNLIAVLEPQLVGTTTFLNKAINTGGVYSVLAASVAVVVPPIGSFPVTTETINNFVALTWVEPTSTFNIHHYIITRNGGVIVSDFRSTFFTRQEQQAGTYTYGITAVDIAGNLSPETTVTLTVTGPSDFEIQDSQISDLSGTIVNGLVYADRLYVCINTIETIFEHFDDRSWGTPQQQIDAGYPRWLSPNEATASYEETFDFGAIYTNVVVNLSWLFETIVGSFTFGVSATVSDDDITYSSPFTASSFFVTSARYVKVELTFTGNNDKALMAFYNFQCTLAVKREVDGGEADVFAADATGTVIPFEKVFKFVESITITPQETNVVNWSYAFAGGANPVSFKALLWDAAGVRIDGHISWKARGVV